MKHGIVFFLVLSIALLYYVCCASSLAAAALQDRNPRRLLISTNYQGIQEEKSQAVGGVEVWTSSSLEETDETVYHLDYHGVKTHPSPTPKIPRP